MVQGREVQECKKKLGPKNKKKVGILGHIMCNVTRAQTRAHLHMVNQFCKEHKNAFTMLVEDIVGLCSG